MNKTFGGFPEGKVHLTPIPAPFFSELLPEIDDVGELKVILYAFWRLDRMEGSFRYLRWSDFAEDIRFMEGMAAGKQASETALSAALNRAVVRGSMIEASVVLENGPERLFFMNTPKGRAAAEAVQRGDWRPSGQPQLPVELGSERPNVFRLYEEHIGPLTPMIAESLQQAEATYPPDWIEDAIRAAVENNKRSWRYAEAILRRWQEGGRDERKNRRDSEKDRRRYTEWED